MMFSKGFFSLLCLGGLVLANGGFSEAKGPLRASAEIQDCDQVNPYYF